MRIKVHLLSVFLVVIFYTSTIHALSWDEETPEEVGPGGSIEISINGDCPPYTWVASGQGYAFESAETEGETNTLNAEDDACGSVTIMVADSCGETIIEKGAVRNPESGHWKDIYPGCVWNCEERPELYTLCGAGTFIRPGIGGGNWYELIKGGRRTEQKTGWQGGCWRLDPPQHCPPDSDCVHCPPNQIAAPNCIDPRWAPHYPYMCTSSEDNTVNCYEARSLIYQEWVCPGAYFTFPDDLDTNPPPPPSGSAGSGGGGPGPGPGDDDGC